MTTVAEAVEKQEQLDHLLRAGCDEAQGYFHSRPLPKSLFEKWLPRYSAPGAKNDISSILG
jgi:diguanylate cyclase